MKNFDQNLLRQEQNKEESLLGSEGFEIKEITEELKLDFKSENDKDIEDYFSDDIEKSCKVHSYLFEKGVKEDDPDRRRSIHLAHLDLELENHKHTDIVSPYGDKIGKSGKPICEVFATHFTYDQMLVDGQEIAKSNIGEKLKIEMEELREVFLEFADHYLEIKQVLAKNNPQEDLNKIERMAIIIAADREAKIFFNGMGSHSGEKNKKLYKENKTMSLHDFEGKQNAVCTEYAMLTQQLISFAGLRSKFVSGGPLEIANDEGEFDSVPIESHAYNIISLQGNKNEEETTVLFDPSNPAMVKDKTDPSVSRPKTYLAPLTKKQLEEMEDNGSIIDHEGTKRVYSFKD